MLITLYAKPHTANSESSEYDYDLRRHLRTSSSYHASY